MTNGMSTTHVRYAYVLAWQLLPLTQSEFVPDSKTEYQRLFSQRPRKRRYIDWKSIQTWFAVHANVNIQNTFTQFHKQKKYYMWKTLFLNQNAHGFVYHISLASAPSIHVVLLGMHEPWSHTFSPVQQQKYCISGFIRVSHASGIKETSQTRVLALGFADL